MKKNKKTSEEPFKKAFTEKREHCIVCGSLINRGSSQSKITKRRDNSVACSSPCSRVYRMIYCYCRGKFLLQQTKQVEELKKVIKNSKQMEGCKHWLYRWIDEIFKKKSFSLKKKTSEKKDE